MGTNVTSAGNPGDGRPVSQDVTLSFETFYHGTSPRLLRYAYGLTGDMAEAQDFTQEAYTRAWQRWKRLQSYDNPESWLRLVVTRLATDRWRWLGVRRAAQEKRADPVPGPDETLTDLIAELKRLPMAALPMEPIMPYCSWDTKTLACPTAEGIAVISY